MVKPSQATKNHQWFIPFKASGKRQSIVLCCAAYSPRPCCCWVWSTQRYPARTQCPSWWASSGHPHRSASGRQHTWSTPDGKLCPAHASSSQTLESSSHRKRRVHPDQRVWVNEQRLSSYRGEDENIHLTLITRICDQPFQVSSIGDCVGLNSWLL